MTVVMKRYTCRQADRINAKDISKQSSSLISHIEHRSQPKSLRTRSLSKQNQEERETPSPTSLSIASSYALDFQGITRGEIVHPIYWVLHGLQGDRSFFILILSLHRWGCARLRGGLVGMGVEGPGCGEVEVRVQID